MPVTLNQIRREDHCQFQSPIELLSPAPASISFHVVESPSHHQAPAVLWFQHNAGLMTSNLQVLGQFVTSLDRMSSEVLRLALGPEAVDVLSPVRRLHTGIEDVLKAGRHNDLRTP